MKVLQFKREQAETEGARRATEGSACSDRSKIPDPEVAEVAKRRRFTAEYKIRILREADACKGDGDIGALLRREGLYSSNLTAWRRQRDAIAREGLTARKRGRKAKQIDPRVKELERENTLLKRKLKRAEMILDIQKKASELLGISLENPYSEEND
jgi:transposase-like protein